MTMSSADHRAAAEEHLKKAKKAEDPERNLLIAQVHATLALAPEPKPKDFKTSREW